MLAAVLLPRRTEASSMSLLSAQVRGSDYGTVGWIWTVLKVRRISPPFSGLDTDEMIAESQSYGKKRDAGISITSISGYGPWGYARCAEFDMNIPQTSVNTVLCRNWLSSQ